MKRIVTVAIVLALLGAAGWYLTFRPRPELTVSADFAYADGIYPENRVTILGVPVGTVGSVRPQGATVRVTMRLPADTHVPATAKAYIMNPAVISDRYVELGPAHTGGPELADGAVIPPERTHSPIRWDQLVSTVDELLTALGPAGANSGDALHAAAAALGGNGPALRQAVRNIDQAMSLLAGNSGDLGGLLDNLNQLVTVLARHRSTVDSLVSTLSQAGRDFAGQQANIGNTISQLSGALEQIRVLLRERGGDLTGGLANLATLTTTIAAHQQDLAQTLDVLPLAFDNLALAVTPDERMRIRVDVSTTLTQFPATAALCQRFPMPLCSGAGLVNPIQFPPQLGDLFSGGGK